jgi:hypothetical protein
LNPSTHLTSSVSLTSFYIKKMLFFTVALSALATLAVATPTPCLGCDITRGNAPVPAPAPAPAPAPVPTPASAPADQCNTGPVQCCNTVEDKNSMSDNTTKLMGLAGLKVGDITGKIGTNCTPISVLAVGGNKW